MDKYELNYLLDTIDNPINGGLTTMEKNHL